MKKNNVKTPWYGLSKFILLVVALPCIILGIVYLFRPARTLAWLINGIIWLVVGCVLLLKATLSRRKLENLKKIGKCYNGTIVNILPSSAIRISNYITARIECVVQTQEGRRSFISDYYLLTPFDQKDKLSAKIYINTNKTEKYAIELSRIDNEMSLDEINAEIIAVREERKLKQSEHLEEHILL